MRVLRPKSVAQVAPVEIDSEETISESDSDDGAYDDFHTPPGPGAAGTYDHNVQDGRGDPDCHRVDALVTLAKSFLDNIMLALHALRYGAQRQRRATGCQTKQNKRPIDTGRGCGVRNRAGSRSSWYSRSSGPLARCRGAGRTCVFAAARAGSASQARSAPTFLLSDARGRWEVRLADG